MAIQFNCPYCTSQIRVPDSASGRRGTCPRCKSKIIVPKLKAKAKAKRPGSARPQAAADQAALSSAADERSKTKTAKQTLTERFGEEPDFSHFGDSTAATEVSGSEPMFRPDNGDGNAIPSDRAAGPSSPAFSTEPTTPYARALFRRRRRKKYLWVPVLFGLLLVGGATAFFLITGRKKLQGTLPAVALAETRLGPRTIERASIPADDAKVDAVLKHLQQQANQISRLASTRDLMVHQVQVSDAGFSIRVEAPRGKRFYRVDVRKNAALKQFLGDNDETLEKPRRAEIRDGLKRFFEQAAGSAADGGVIDQDLIDEFRRHVVVNSLVHGAGYNLVAVIGRDAYRCVYEDGSGRLYYLLPEGTGRFTLRGRQLASGVRLFPGRYTVAVEGPLHPAAETPPSVKTREGVGAKTAAEKTEPGPDETIE